MCCRSREQRNTFRFPSHRHSKYGFAVDDVDSNDITKIESRESNEEKGNPLVLFSAASGSNIIAAGTGTIQSVTSDAKFGNYISIDHGNGYISIYRNSGTPIVSEGDEVDRGDILFVVDGNNTKLGYQIQKDDNYINPEELIEING
ncbi:MAG: M23 family metallopeptidase [Butyrivibrio sp.]|nr:M23 family metallopeptidase [Butyrivibrio sp.]